MSIGSGKSLGWGKGVWMFRIAGCEVNVMTIEIIELTHAKQ